jgi:phenylpyruvate tautomerase PptA (4-oxalocrotonate tautomerase family)
MHAMPLIKLRVNQAFSEMTRNHLVQGLCLITEGILRKRKELIALRLEAADQKMQWYVGGSAKGDDEAIFELSITITKGTNTEEEKAQWIAEAWKLLTDILGTPPHPNYILIEEIDSKNWGYNGLTQSAAKNAISKDMSMNRGAEEISGNDQPMTNGQIKLDPFPYNSVNDKVLKFNGMDNVSLPFHLEFVPYQLDVRKGVEIYTLFSQADQDPQGPDAAILKYEPGAFVALHEHIGHEMVVVLAGDYIENGVTFLPGSLILRSPGTFHTMASTNGCTILATRYIPVKQRPDLWNEFASRNEGIKPVADRLLT